MHRGLIAALAVTSCYRPRLEAACNVACDEDQTCPGELVCGGDNLCHAAGSIECSMQDASTDTLDDGSTCITPLLLSGFGTVCGAIPNLNLVTGFDTDSDPRCTSHDQAGSNQVCAVLAHDVVIAVPFVATGSRPLAILAIGTITLNAGTGELSVASHVAGAGGAGASDAPLCGFTIAGGADSGAGGGAGGAFQGSGGSGGAAGAAGGTGTPALAPPTILRGGCAGSPGGQADSAISPGGLGGGALFLYAQGAIQLGAVIDASGAGATAPFGPQGGGGGGAGGMIAIESPSITVEATMFALGGGGASGGGGTTIGNPGTDPLTSSLASGAAGGHAAADPVVTGDASGSGGAGCSQTVLAGGAGGDASEGTGVGVDGGGGGGGGCGYIVLSTKPQGPGPIAPAANVP